MTPNPTSIHHSMIRNIKSSKPLSRTFVSLRETAISLNSWDMGELNIGCEVHSGLKKCIKFDKFTFIIKSLQTLDVYNCCYT